MRNVGAVLTVVVFLLVGCNGGPTGSQAEPRNSHQSTFVWVGSPAVDLMSSEGTFIRAVVESWVLAFSQPGRGIEAVRAAGYPGFEHAFNNIWDPKDWAGNGNVGTPEVGTDYFQVIEMSLAHGIYSAIICNYSSMKATEIGGGFKSPGVNVGQVMSLSFGPDDAVPSDTQRRPPTDQKGPAERPHNDVFGTWITTQFGGLSSGEPRCQRPAPGTPAGSTPRPDAPPRLAPDPGWPGDGS